MKKKEFRSALSNINRYVESTIGNQSETFQTRDISDMGDCALKRYLTFLKSGIKIVTGNEPRLLTSYLCGGSTLHEKAITEIAKVIMNPKNFNTSPECDSLRREIIDVITSIYSESSMVNLGFSKNSRKESLKRKREELDSLPPPKKRKPSVTPEIEQELFNHCSSDEYTKPGRRSVVIKVDGVKTKKEVRHFTKPVSRIINNFAPFVQGKVGETALRQTIKDVKIFKKPCRETCLCPHCEERKNLVKWLNTKSDNRYEFQLYHSYSKRFPSKKSWSRYVQKEDHANFQTKLSKIYHGNCTENCPKNSSMQGETERREC